jgi:acetyltransferase-like isoleucine patch superfamily enzyme
MRNARLQARIVRRLSESRFLGAVIRETFARHPLIFGGPASRVTLGRDVQLNDATLNVASGSIRLDDDVFCGHGVSLLTGTHDLEQMGAARRLSIPDCGRDIVVETGVWLSSNCTILGPCTIGAHAVVAAGAVVTGNVEGWTLVAGVPARPVARLDRPHDPDRSTDVSPPDTNERTADG